MYPTVLILVLIGLVLGIGLYTLALFGDSAFTESVTNTTSEIILTDEDSPITLAQTPNTNTFNATRFNQTWLEFDGVYDAF